MTRRGTTGIIFAILILAAAVIATLVIMEQRREYERQWPGCWRLVGEDIQCKAAIATIRLRGY